MLSILIIAILNSQSDNSISESGSAISESAVSESGSDSSFVHSEWAFCLLV